MQRSRYILYFSFFLIFMIFHGIGAVSVNLPYVLNAVLTFSVVSVSLIMLDKWYSKISYLQVLFNLGFHFVSFKKIFPGILISVFLLLLYPVFYFLFGFGIVLNDAWLLNLAGIFLTGGLAEEMFFRGFLFRHLRESMNFRKASLTSMILFAAVHLLMFIYKDWPVALLSTILAVVIAIPLSYLFERADNTVWSPAILHASVRTIGLVVTGPENIFMQMTLYWITGSMIIPLVIVLLFKDFRKMWKTE